jgi:D-tagatose-bisphosphate aldolase class II non-catalytic subunit
MSGVEQLTAITTANRRTRQGGIPSFCTAHPDTLSAIFRASAEGSDSVLVEATCNQVNQFGGYTGMTAVDFRRFVNGLATDVGLDPARIILGGDHLGPNPWKKEPSAAAMAKARELVRSFVAAGYSKIHLDATMACADDGGLDEDEMAARAADLCAVAEEAAAGRPLVYVIGTEVPVPGGEASTVDTLAVTTPAAVAATYAVHREAFAKLSLGDAFDRIVAVVVQPGIDFANDRVFPFDPVKARGLSGSLDQLPGVIFEAHSTDYQSRQALAELVANHFAILKVGPELTFAYREAIVAMAHIEERLAVARPSQALPLVLSVMDENPAQWRDYLAPGDNAETAKLFGLSDRIRYYWPNPRIAAAVAALRANIDASTPPIGLLSQYVGGWYVGSADASGLSISEQVIQAKVGSVVAKYRRACRMDEPSAGHAAR